MGNTALRCTDVGLTELFYATGETGSWDEVDGGFVYQQYTWYLVGDDWESYWLYDCYDTGCIGLYGHDDPGAAVIHQSTVGYNDITVLYDLYPYYLEGLEDKCIVEYSYDDGTSWNNIETYSGSNTWQLSHPDEQRLLSSNSWDSAGFQLRFRADTDDLDESLFGKTDSTSPLKDICYIHYISICGNSKGDPEPEVCGTVGLALDGGKKAHSCECRESCGESYCKSMSFISQRLDLGLGDTEVNALCPDSSVCCCSCPPCSNWISV